MPDAADPKTKWLSYGSAKRHPCIEKNPELSLWNANGGAEIEGVDCVDLKAKGRDEEIWEVRRIAFGIYA